MPTVTKNLIIINVLLFLGQLVAQSYGINLSDYLGLHFFLADNFNVYARRIQPHLFQYVRSMDVRPDS